MAAKGTTTEAASSSLTILTPKARPYNDKSCKPPKQLLPAMEGEPFPGNPPGMPPMGSQENPFPGAHLRWWPKPPGMLPMIMDASSSSHKDNDLETAPWRVPKGTTTEATSSASEKTREVDKRKSPMETALAPPWTEYPPTTQRKQSRTPAIWLPTMSTQSQHIAGSA